MTSITELWRIQNSFNIVKNEIKQNADFDPQIAALRFTRSTFSNKQMKVNPVDLPVAQQGHNRDYDQMIADTEFRIERETVIDQQNSLETKPKAFFGFKLNFDIKEKLTKKLNKLIQKGENLNRVDIDEIGVKDFSVEYSELAFIYNENINDIVRDAEFLPKFHALIIKLNRVVQKTKQTLEKYYLGLEETDDPKTSIKKQNIGYILRILENILTTSELMLEGKNTNQYLSDNPINMAVETGPAPTEPTEDDIIMEESDDIYISNIKSKMQLLLKNKAFKEAPMEQLKELAYKFASADDETREYLDKIFSEDDPWNKFRRFIDSYVKDLMKDDTLFQKVYDEFSPDRMDLFNYIYLTDYNEDLQMLIVDPLPEDIAKMRKELLEILYKDFFNQKAKATLMSLKSGRQIDEYVDEYFKTHTYIMPKAEYDRIMKLDRSNKIIEYLKFIKTYDTDDYTESPSKPPTTDSSGAATGVVNPPRVAPTPGSGTTEDGDPSSGAPGTAGDAERDEAHDTGPTPAVASAKDSGIFSSMIDRFNAWYRTPGSTAGTPASGTVRRQLDFGKSTDKGKAKYLSDDMPPLEEVEDTEEGEGEEERKGAEEKPDNNYTVLDKEMEGVTYTVSNTVDKYHYKNQTEALNITARGGRGAWVNDYYATLPELINTLFSTEPTPPQLFGQDFFNSSKLKNYTTKGFSAGAKAVRPKNYALLTLDTLKQAYMMNNANPDKTKRLDFERIARKLLEKYWSYFIEV